MHESLERLDSNVLNSSRLELSGGSYPVLSQPDSGILVYDVTAQKFMVSENGGSYSTLGGGIGTGDVVGPGSAVSGNIVLFDGTTGKLIKDSGISSVPVVSDTAYDATTWNGNTDAPTKNVIRDKIETLGSAAYTASTAYDAAGAAAAITLSGLGGVPTSRTINGYDLTANRSLTTADVADSTNKRYVSDANLTVIGNTSGTNTGDQNLSGYAPIASPTFTGTVGGITAAMVGADASGTAAGAVSTHAALTTGVHGLAITAGQTLTVTAGGTIGSAAYTASTAYDAAGAAAAVISDTAYNATTWDGVTTIAPSKNAVRDKIESLPTIATTSTFLKGDGAGNAVAAVSGTDYMVITGTPSSGYVPIASDATHAAWGAMIPTTRTLTINGTAQDLSADRSWTVTASLPDIVPQKQSPAASVTVATATSVVTARRYAITGTNNLTIAGTGVFCIC